MDKNTVYILQKDCLDAKAGDEFEFSESSDCYSKIGGDCQIDYLSALFVENNPEWFKPKEEVNESKPTEQFQWTDELVKEMVSFLAKTFKWDKGQSIGFSEQFKKSKSKKEEPQWEILEIECYGGEIRKLIDGEYRLYTDGVGFTATYLLQRSDSKIKTVKRLSDGEVFSVGDSLDWMGKIESIEIDDRFNGGIAFINNSQKSCISTAKKAPKEEQRVGEDMICPVTKKHCDDECCPVGAVCNLSSDDIKDCENPSPKEEQVVKLYTESELLQARREGFDAAREVTYSYVGDFEFPNLKTKFKTREDYINSLK